MKIVYCIDEIEASGGTERITLKKAVSLAKIPGNDLYIVVAYNRTDIVGSIGGVHLIDLDVRYYDDIGLRRIPELLFVIKKRHEHKKKMLCVLEQIKPDIVVSTGMSEKSFISKLKISSDPVFLREIHFNKFYRRKIAKSKYEKILACFGEFWDYNFAIKGFDKIVVLTQEDFVSNWEEGSNVAVMPNPLAHPSSEFTSFSNKIVITAGRLERQKNHSSLIEAWRIVAEAHPDWILKIFGKGSLRDALQSRIDSYGLRGKVLLEGYTPDIMHEMAESSVFVLSSITEGMPLVIIEAMSCGLPVISYDCPTGPKDMITDGLNGFLVPTNDSQCLAERLCALIEDHTLMETMGANALETSKQYLPDKIIPRWMSLFSQLLKEKRS